MGEGRPETSRSVNFEREARPAGEADVGHYRRVFSAMGTCTPRSAATRTASS